MSNFISNELKAQIFAQESEDPFLILVTLSHPSISDIRLVNNTEDVTSEGLLYIAFPMRIILPRDDGESVREISIEFDNVDRDLIDLIRSVTGPISVSLKLVLASLPDAVQFAFDELKIATITYNSSRVSARLYMDTFLNTEMTSEKYTPQNYPGIF